MPSASTRHINIAIKIAMPCFLFFTALPKVKHNAAGINRMEIISIKLVKAFGFSNGCAELTPLNPPPLVPDCLIAIWLAAGPIGTNCSVTISASGITCPFTVTVSASRLISAFSRIVPSALTAIGSTRDTVSAPFRFCITPPPTNSKEITKLSGRRI